MRQLTSHKVNGLNEALQIDVIDQPGQGNACHAYVISFDKKNFEATERIAVPISFQNGPILDSGVNGISQEALLAIIEDRLIGFQGGSYANDDNAEALVYVQRAMAALHRRTKERMSRGVEGTNQK